MQRGVIRVETFTLSLHWQAAFTCRQARRPVSPYQSVTGGLEAAHCHAVRIDCKMLTQIAPMATFVGNAGYDVLNKYTIFVLTLFCFKGANQCRDISRKGGCSLQPYMYIYNFYDWNTNQFDTSSSDYTTLQAACTAAGGTIYLDRGAPWEQPRCDLNSITTEPVCVAPCRASDGPKPARRYVCANRAITTDSACRNVKRDGNDGM
jgi:hypothetical protein